MDRLALGLNTTAVLRRDDSAKIEVYFDCKQDVDGLSHASTRFKHPLAEGFSCVLFKAVAERSNYADDLGSTVRPHNRLEQDRTLHPSSLCHGRILWDQLLIVLWAA